MRFQLKTSLRGLMEELGHGKRKQRGKLEVPKADMWRTEGPQMLMSQGPLPGDMNFQ